MRIDVDLARVLSLDLVHQLERDAVESEVLGAALDRPHRIAGGRLGHDAVGVAGRLRGVRPFAEEGIADEREVPPGL